MYFGIFSYPSIQEDKLLCECGLRPTPSLMIEALQLTTQLTAMIRQNAHIS